VNWAQIEPLADALLYEGYLLYPYRPSALKNRERWVFGVLLPRSYSDATGGLEPWSSQSECLVSGDAATRIEARLRFLQPALCRSESTGGGAAAGSWEEAVPRCVELGPLALAQLGGSGLRHGFGFGPLRAVADGRVCEQARIEGALELAAEPVAERTYRLTVRVLNLSPLPASLSPRPASPSLPPASDGVRRESALRRALASTHVLLGAASGEFVPPLAPPAELRALAQTCRSDGAWPILVGEPGARDALLCSPIILEDYPRIAPESPGDLFDATEIDEILTLRILTLTDAERRAMTADPRTAALLARTEALAEGGLARLHGALRSPRQRRAIRVAGVELAAGDRVRLRPCGRSDIFDLALVGRGATIASVEQDWDGQCYFAVTVDDDPGRDLGAEGKPGHRFFFRPHEVEPLGSDEP
jgi:hypothetical protein